MEDTVTQRLIVNDGNTTDARPYKKRPNHHAAAANSTPRQARAAGGQWWWVVGGSTWKSRESTVAARAGTPHWSRFGPPSTFEP